MSLLQKHLAISFLIVGTLFYLLLIMSATAEIDIYVNSHILKKNFDENVFKSRKFRIQLTSELIFWEHFSSGWQFPKYYKDQCCFYNVKSNDGNNCMQLQTFSATNKRRCFYDFIHRSDEPCWCSFQFRKPHLQSDLIGKWVIKNRLQSFHNWDHNFVVCSFR